MVLDYLNAHTLGALHEASLLADDLAPSNDDDGVAAVLERLLLGR